MILNSFLKKIFYFLSFTSIALLLVSCGGGGSDEKDDSTTVPGTAATASLGFDIKTFSFTWTDVSDATFYRVMENPDGVSGFTQVSGDIASGAQSFNHEVALYQRINASYFLQSCNSAGCTDGDTISITGTLTDAVGYFKASSGDSGDEFGLDVALSADGKTMAVGAQHESSGVIGDEDDDTQASAGAAYVFTNSGSGWSQQAYIKADAPMSGEFFGAAVSLSAAGDVLAVGAPFESTGRVYIFTRSGMNWTKQDKVNATSGGAGDFFGDAISLSDDGSTLAVAARSEASESTGLGSDGADPSLNGAANAGAAYIFIESGGSWTQQEYFKADNAQGGDLFGSSVSLSSAGNTFVVGASDEDSAAGAAYVFIRSGSDWSQQAYLKASIADGGDNFGSAVSLSDDGNTLAVGAVSEDSMATGIDGNDADNNASESGAAYVFVRSGTNWSQQAYIKASNAGMDDSFGRSVSLSANGDVLAVGAENEQSNATGINGDEINNALNGGTGAGAAYVFTNASGVWSQQAYVKASNTSDNDFFGTALSVSGDGAALAVGAKIEGDSGAAYLY